MSDELRDELDRGLAELNIVVDSAAKDKLINYFNILAKWNRSIRLVGRAEGPDDFRNLVIDSLAVLHALRPDDERVVDVGSGAGLPGLVVAIARPELEVVSVEPIHKKVAFQRAAQRELRISNHRAHAVRIEQLSETGFDACVSRAAFDLGDWMTMGSRLVREGGIVIGLANPDQAAGFDLSADSIHYVVGGRERMLLVSEVVGRVGAD